MRGPLISLLAVGLGAGCAVRGTDIVPRHVDSAASFASATHEALDAGAPEDAWWRTFGDAVLDDLVQRAFVANPDVRQATATVREARAVLRERRFDRRPRGQVVGSYARTQTSEAAYGPVAFSDDLFDGGFDASWETDLFGALRGQVRAARADLTGVELTRRAVLVSVAAEVARAYVDLRGAQARLAVARRNVETQERSALLARQLLEAGRGTQLDVDRSIVLLERTRATIPPLDAGAAAATYRLATLVGREPQALHAELTPAGALPLPPSRIAVGEPAALLRRRPDVGAAATGVLAAAARADVAAAALYPRVVLTGALGLQATRLVDLTDDALRFGVGVAVTLPILERDRLRERIIAADARAEAALAAYDRTALLALEDAERAITSYARERERAAHLSDAARAAASASELARQRYRYGVDSYLAVLDAEREQLTAEDQLEQSRIQTLVFAIAIHKALGGGWSDGEKATAAVLDRDEYARLRAVVRVQRGTPRATP